MCGYAVSVDASGSIKLDPVECFDSAMGAWEVAAHSNGGGQCKWWAGVGCHQ